MLIDTNILIFYLKGDPEIISALSTWKREGKPLFITTITVAEILALPKLTSKEIEKIMNFLQGFVAVPLDNKLAELVATIKRTYSLNLADAIIAGTAIDNNLPLITRDRHFRKVKELTIIYL